MQALDLYTPFLMIVGGLAGIFYTSILGRFLKSRPQSYLTESIEAVHQRFASRTKLSWILLVVGTFWMLQLVLEPHV